MLTCSFQEATRAGHSSSHSRHDVESTEKTWHMMDDVTCIIKRRGHFQSCGRNVLSEISQAQKDKYCM